MGAATVQVVECVGRGGTCQSRQQVAEARTPAIAAVRAGARGWKITDEGAFCPDCRDQAPAPPTGPLRPVARVGAGIGHLGRPVVLPAPVLLEDDAAADVCDRCSDGEHWLCRRGGCTCTAEACRR